MSEEAFSKFHLGDFALESGEVLPSAFLAYETFGDSKSPALIYPTWFGGPIRDNCSVISPANAAFDPNKYFIIVPALFGNGESTSPSNTPALRQDFPAVTIADNVRAQYQLVTAGLGIKHARAVLGWSMSAMQAFHWAVQYPDFMDGIIPYAGSAKTSIHNAVFLEGVKSGLIAARGGVSKGIGKGQAFPLPGPWSEREKQVGLKALARVYAGWGFSQQFYREEQYQHFGYPDVESFLTGFWEAWALQKDPDDLLAMIRTWQLGDIAAGLDFGGDFQKALRSIRVPALVMPSRTDLYFPPEDAQFEVETMSPGIGVYREIPSIFGHHAAAPSFWKEDWDFLHGSIENFLLQIGPNSGKE
ncbi:Ethyl acetate hydrolase [Exophiala dermatitidis]